ncbi:hypothetical protein L7F22_061478 [Adiantum nelumboides]|nr:hypothetical protein [Adiantum nelumboides]
MLYADDIVLLTESQEDLQLHIEALGLFCIQRVVTVNLGVVAGIYSGMEYGMEKVRGKRDWKNALLGGALTGALLTFGERLTQGWQIYWAYLKR